MAGCKPSVEVHDHTNSDEWSFDGEYHWHAATCEHTEAVTGREPHTFGEWSEGKRSCSVCDYEQICGHTWDEGVVTTVPTLVEEGVKNYTCTECGETKTENISAFGWCESPVDAVTGLAATSSSTYVYFGVFPKTVLPLDSTDTVDEEDFVEMGTTKYYKGSDGEYYAKVLENAYGTGAEYKYENKVEQVKQKSAGSYRYFKVEPIKWKVLTTTYDIDGDAGSATGALLLAEDILTSNVPYYEDKDNNRTIDGKTVYPNNYKHSQIRAYLNGFSYQGQSGIVAQWNGNGFLQTAFTEAAQEKIATIEVDNRAETTGYSEDTYATTYVCENTNDKIFLLSESEVINSSYGFAAYSSDGKGNARIRMPTDYAKANYALQSSTDGYGGWWWLRSPYYFNSSKARYVDYNGYASNSHYVYSTNRGVVPALSILLQQYSGYYLINQNHKGLVTNSGRSFFYHIEKKNEVCRFLRQSLHYYNCII